MFVNCSVQLKYQETVIRSPGTGNLNVKAVTKKKQTRGFGEIREPLITKD